MNWQATEVGVIDQCEAVARALQTFAVPGWAVNWYPCAEDALAARAHQDVWVVEVLGQCGAFNAAELVARLSAGAHRVVVYTAESRPRVLGEIKRAGAASVLPKSAPLTDLVAAVRSAPVPPSRRTGVRARNCHGLSRRQQQVLSARARGESFPSIGARLGISPRTAAEYLAVVAQKFPGYFVEHSPADLERDLGVGPGDVLDWTKSSASSARG